MQTHTTNLCVRVDKKLKNDSEHLLDDLGMNMSTAINLFLKQTLRNQAIPFPISMNKLPNQETLAAMEEARALAKDPNAKTFASVKDLMKDLKE